MITLFFTRGPVRSWSDAKEGDTARFGAGTRGMLARGHYWPPSQFEAAFFGNAHTEKDIDATSQAADEVIATEVLRAA